MSATVDIFVARQPIFDTKDEIAGYELLYRRNSTAVSADCDGPSNMSAEVILNAFVGIGIHDVTGGAPALINVDRELLLTRDVLLLDKRKVILEILETVEPSDEVVSACEELQAMGYRLALDDLSSVRERRALLPYAEMVKIDVLEHGMDGLPGLVRGLADYDVELLAECVETERMRDHCRELGFSLFQGHYYRAPETIASHAMAVRDLDLLKLLNLILDLQVSDGKIEDHFRGSPALAYKLLRIANSAALGGRGLTSISHALRLLGRRALHRWLSLLLVTSLAGSSGMDQQVTETAVCRGRFLELLAIASDRMDRGEAFLAGMFSLLEALTRRPMAETLKMLDLSRDLRDALLERKGPLGAWLGFAEAYETGVWKEVDHFLEGEPIGPSTVADLYLQSIIWARSRLEVVGR